MAIRIQDLQPGDEIQCWMRNGLALRPTVTGFVKPYYMVPVKPGRARNGDHTRFVGWVVRNDPAQKIITVHVAPFNSWRQTVNDGIPKRADIAYVAFRRVRKLSATTFEARPLVPGDKGTRETRRPGSIAPFGGTNYRPYRTTEEVLLR